MKKILVLLTLPLAALADPGPATRYLMNEPVSLLDIGIYRASLDLDRLKETMKSQVDQAYGQEVFYFVPEVMYEFDDDLLVFIFHLSHDADDKKLCDALFDVSNDLISKWIEHWFSHQGYENNNQPDDLMAQLRKRTQIVCSTARATAYKMLTESEPTWKGEPQ